MTKTNTHERMLRLVQLAFLTAIVAVLQILSYNIKIGIVSLSLVILPIVIGAMLFGAGAGTYLGGVFGLVTFIAAATGFDTGAFMLFEINPFLTFALCIIKGMAAGFVAGLVYKPLSKRIKNKYVPALIAAACAPVVNTGIFCASMLIFFRDTLNIWADGGNVITYILVGPIFINFTFEFVTSILISPVIVSVLIKTKSFKKSVKG